MPGTSERPANRVVVLFGATGDLAKRMLFPALFELFRRQLMPADFRVVGSGRHSPGDDDEFRGQLAEALGDDADGDEWDDFVRRVSFVVSSDDDGEDLAAAVKSAEGEIEANGERLIYLSVPPEALAGMVEMLDSSGLTKGAALVTEKPFGHDVASARELNSALRDVAPEESIYRIDHFLGKEATQNLVVLRFANGLLEPLWNRDHVAYVQIDVPEEIDIEGRGSFYEETGAFSDMVVNHLLQTLALVAVERPETLDTEALHAERTKVLAAVEPLDPDRVVFGQYEGYRDEDDVDPDSRRETLAALEVRVENDRWSGVPFFLRTGKAMGGDRRTVTVGLRDVEARQARPTELVFELADDPTVAIWVRVKEPGAGLTLRPAAFRLDVEAEVPDAKGLEAYARLLHDVMVGDHTLFSTAEQIERLWEICEPVLQARPDPLPYAKGSWGPDEALELPVAPGWRLPEDGSSG